MYPTLTRLIDVRVVLQRPPLWARVLTWGIITYWRGWVVQGGFQMADGRIWVFTSDPAPKAPTPTDVAAATAEAFSLRLKEAYEYYGIMAKEAATKGDKT